MPSKLMVKISASLRMFLISSLLKILNDGSQNFLNPIRMTRAVAVMAKTKNSELKLSPPTPLLIWTYLGMVMRRAKANKM
jgi:hypothetical protein